MSNLPDALVRDAMEPSASSSDLDMLNGGTGGKKSSFDRIVEKLEAMYPHYARFVACNTCNKGTRSLYLLLTPSEL